MLAGSPVRPVQGLPATLRRTHRTSPPGGTSRPKAGGGGKRRRGPPGRPDVGEGGELRVAAQGSRHSPRSLRHVSGRTGASTGLRCGGGGPPVFPGGRGGVGVRPRRRKAAPDRRPRAACPGGSAPSRPRPRRGTENARATRRRRTVMTSGRRSGDGLACRRHLGTAHAVQHCTDPAPGRRPLLVRRPYTERRPPPVAPSGPSRSVRAARPSCCAGCSRARATRSRPVPVTGAPPFRCVHRKGGAGHPAGGPGPADRGVAVLTADRDGCGGTPVIGGTPRARNASPGR